jgi:DNA repair photolyase
MATKREIFAKTILTKTRIPGYGYCVNPYVGCEHGCRYCYASFMKRFTSHKEPWGEFVDVKVNAPQVLGRELKRARRGSVLVGTVTDPYQLAESHYQITRGCLQAFLEVQFPVSLLTRSPLVLRDMDMFLRFQDIAVGLTIGTDSETVKHTFEPRSPSIRSRVEALRALHEQGIRTYAFIGPMLPLNPLKLATELAGTVDEILIDRLNYSHRVRALYRQTGFSKYLEDDYFYGTATELKGLFEQAGIPASVCF